MIFLGNLTQVDNTNFLVGLVHSNPLEVADSLNLAVDELNSVGLLVESVPSPQPPNGQTVSGMYVNRETGVVTYEYKIPPKTQEEIVAELRAENAQIVYALMNGGLI